jgi:hypothetical protein
MRPFKITPQLHDELMAKISQRLKEASLTSNIFTFTESLSDTKSKDKVFITFSMKAYIKMRDLVDRYASEVGWFGFIDKISDLEYHITDICVYPQLVTGATVKETNEPWDDDMPIDQIKRRHFHGHSHVNMMPSPSSTDHKHRDDQLALVKSDSFYLFMITNKSCAWTAVLYDLAGNTVYGTDDILMDVDLGDGEMLSDFVDSSKKMIKTSTPAALKQMMDERAGVKPAVPAAPPVVTTTNCYGKDPWLPKPAAKVEEKNKKNNKKNGKVYKGESVYSQLGLSDFMTEEEIEREAAKEPGYFDEFTGYVSDTPAVVNRAVLSMMR